jgi:Fur family peroxide stress response transcriptional regulator
LGLFPGDRPTYPAAVMPTSPHGAVVPRRHRSQQRDRILSWLRATDTHPTAREIHAGLLPELSDLSLGTVYRNLEVLVAERAAEEVACAGGVARYDANLEPHHHFHCERCRRILDVDVPAPKGLAKRLAVRHGLQSRRVGISFFGICPGCESQECESQESESSATNDAAR